MYRTAQWIKSRVHTRQHGEAAVMSIRESNADQIDAEMRENSQIKKKQMLRTTMERYWVLVVYIYILCSIILLYE